MKDILVNEEKGLTTTGYIVCIAVGLICLIAGEKQILDQLPQELKELAFPIHPLTRPDWL